MITNNHYKHSEWKSKDIKLFYLMTGLMGAFLGVAIFCLMVLMWSPAAAEDLPEGSCWVMCRPETNGTANDVLIRERPQKKATVVGSVPAGTKIRTDWQEKNGWLHVIDLNNESGEGWISERYVVYVEPQEVNRRMTISGNRVACRKWIGGEIRKRAKKGQTVFVYMMTGEWAVTEWGYIQSRYLAGDEH